VSEEKKLEKKNETADSGSIKVEKEKKKSGIVSLVAVVLGCFLLVAVILIFLNGQKLNKHVVELKRQIATLQTGKEPKEIILDLDATDDPLHGNPIRCSPLSRQYFEKVKV